MQERQPMFFIEYFSKKEAGYGDLQETYLVTGFRAVIF